MTSFTVALWAVAAVPGFFYDLPWQCLPVDPLSDPMATMEMTACTPTREGEGEGASSDLVAWVERTAEAMARNHLRPHLSRGRAGPHLFSPSRDGFVAVTFVLAEPPANGFTAIVTQTTAPVADLSNQGATSARPGSSGPRRNEPVPSDSVPSDSVPSDSVPSDSVPSDSVPSDSLRNDSLRNHSLRNAAKSLPELRVLPDGVRVLGSESDGDRQLLTLELNSAHTSGATLLEQTLAAVGVKRVSEKGAGRATWQGRPARYHVLEVGRHRSIVTLYREP